MTPYLRMWAPSWAGRALLVCLPEAGAGAEWYRAWADRWPGIVVAAVQLPGRERRWAEPPATDIHEVVRTVAAEIEEVRRDRPLAVFGNSFGGLIGFEVARLVRADALVVCACRAPQLWAGTTGITDEEVEALTVGGNFGDLEGLDAESLELLTGVLRADARLSATYRLDEGASVSCPLHAWGGTRDVIVTPEHLDAWSVLAAGPFHRRDFDTDHHVVANRPDEIAGGLHDVLASLSRAEEVTT